MAQFLNAHLLEIFPHKTVDKRIQTGRPIVGVHDEHRSVLLEPYEPEQLVDRGDSHQVGVQFVFELASVERAQRLLDERPMRRIGHAERAQVRRCAFRQRDEVVAGANEQLVVGVETDAL